MQTVKFSWSYEYCGINLLHSVHNDNNFTRKTASGEISKFVNTATLLNLNLPKICRICQPYAPTPRSSLPGERSVRIGARSSNFANSLRAIDLPLYNYIYSDVIGSSAISLSSSESYLPCILLFSVEISTENFTIKNAYSSFNSWERGVKKKKKGSFKVRFQISLLCSIALFK